jgi:hypothetical protein
MTEKREKVMSTLSKECLKSIKKGLDKDNKVLHKDLTKNSELMDSLNHLLSRYYSNERGQVHSYQIEIDTLEIDDKGKGSFRADYDVYIHDTCADRRHEEEDMFMIIDFEIHLFTGDITFTGELIYDRDPDEI